MNHSHLAKRAGAAALCAVLSTGILSAAATPNKDVTAYLSPDISIVVDGSYRNFYSALGNETHPFLYNGTTYLPIRAIGELMGKNVTWDQAHQTVSLSGINSSGPTEGTPDLNTKPHTIAAKVRPEVSITVDGAERTFTDANGNVIYPMSYNGSVYLPVRNIGALMGKKVGWNNDTRTVSLGSSATNLISPETAKSIALAHAGLQNNQVTFLYAHLEWEDGIQVYDVEFYTKDFREYDYEIDARTGTILSFDYDAEHNPPNPNPGNYISQEEAKRIALAQVPGATSQNISKVELDSDNGRMEYEVKIVFGLLKYEFEIDASTGAILSKEVDSIYD